MMLDKEEVEMESKEETGKENRGEIAMENKENREEENKMTAPRDLEEENRRLLEENKRLKREREEYRKSLPLKERLYDHVNVSLKTMDRIIVLLFVLLGVVLVMGIVNR